MTSPSPRSVIAAGHILSATEVDCEFETTKDVGIFSGHLVQVGGRVARVTESRHQHDRLFNRWVVRAEFLTKSVSLPPRNGDIVECLPQSVPVVGEVSFSYNLSGSQKIPLSIPLNQLIGKFDSSTNISGLPGSAKTSLGLFIARQVQAQASKQEVEVAFIVINNKGMDGLKIDQPAKLTAEEEQVYDELGFDKGPFQNVRKFGPNGSANLLRYGMIPFGYAPNRHFHVLKHLVRDQQSEQQKRLAEMLISERELFPHEFGSDDTWSFLYDGRPLREGYSGANSWKGFQKNTVEKFCRDFRDILSVSNTGVFVDGHSTCKSPKELLGELKAGEVFLFDFSTMNSIEQSACFSDIISTIWADAKSSHRKLPEHICIFFDELNRYASKERHSHPIKRVLEEIFREGRAFGVSVISAQQSASQIDAKIYNTVATAIVCRSNSIELKSPHYSYLRKVDKHFLAHCSQGEFLLYRGGAPYKAFFPRPGFVLGQS